MGRKPINRSTAEQETQEEPASDVSDDIQANADAETSTDGRRRGGPRLTAVQKAEITAALERGESGRTLAEKYNVSLGAIYSYRRKAASTPSAEPQPRQESELRGRLVNFAVRTLLGQAVPEHERTELEHEVREELLKRLAAGI